jgi:hypothetical protein
MIAVRQGSYFSDWLLQHVAASNKPLSASWPPRICSGSRPAASKSWSSNWASSFRPRAKPRRWPGTPTRRSKRSATGREVLGLEISSDDDGAGWPFLRSLTAGGLSGVRLVVSDAHRGLVSAIALHCPARPGSAAAPTTCANCSLKSLSPRSRGSRRWFVRPSTSPTPTPSRPSSPGCWT